MNLRIHNLNLIQKENGDKNKNHPSSIKKHKSQEINIFP